MWFPTIVEMGGMLFNSTPQLLSPELFLSSFLACKEIFQILPLVGDLNLKGTEIRVVKMLLKQCFTANYENGKTKFAAFGFTQSATLSVIRRRLRAKDDCNFFLFDRIPILQFEVLIDTDIDLTQHQHDSCITLGLI